MLAISIANAQNWGIPSYNIKNYHLHMLRTV